MLIEQQKEIADDVLDKLSVIDPHCILAGGAPRNWYFDKKANDLDFYFHAAGVTQQVREKQFAKAGLDLAPIFRGERMEVATYKEMEHLLRVWEGDFHGQPIQVMEMREPTFKSVVDHFGTSICKAWYKGKCHYHDDFLLSVAAQVIFKKDNYTAKETHVAKMLSYFPDYQLFSFKDKEKVLHQLGQAYGVYPSSRHIINYFETHGVLKLTGGVK